MRLLLFIIILSAHELVFAISTAGYTIENYDSEAEDHPPYFFCSSGSDTAFCPGQYLIFILFYNQKVHAFSGSASEVRDKVIEKINFKVLHHSPSPEKKAQAFSDSAPEVRDRVIETIHLEKLDNLPSSAKQRKTYYLPKEFSHTILTTLKNNNAHTAITEQHTFFSNLSVRQVQTTRTIIDHLTDYLPDD